MLLYVIILSCAVSYRLALLCLFRCAVFLHTWFVCAHAFVVVRLHYAGWSTSKALLLLEGCHVSVATSSVRSTVSGLLAVAFLTWVE